MIQGVGHAVNLDQASDPTLFATRHLNAAEEWLNERKTHNAQDAQTATLDALIGVGWALVALGTKKVKAH